MTTRETRSLTNTVKTNPRVTASQLAEAVTENFQKPISVDTVRKTAKSMDIKAELHVENP